MRTYGRYLAGVFSADRGADVRVDDLVTCGRSFYAEPAYEQPATGASLQLKKLIGPHWLVPLCSGSAPTVSVAVSALSDLTVVGGRIADPITQDFFSVGVRLADASGAVTPEEAVRLAAEASGKRVSEIPVLVMPPRPYAPQLAAWQVVLESPVQVRGARSGETRQVRELYVGYASDRRRVLLQLPDPVSSGRTQFRDLGAVRGEFVSVDLVSIRGLSGALESVEVAR